MWERGSELFTTIVRSGNDRALDVILTQFMHQCYIGARWMVNGHLIISFQSLELQCAQWENHNDVSRSHVTIFAFAV
jgi:hypothetical protein